MNLIRGTIAVIVGYLMMAGASMTIVGKLFAEAEAPPESRALIMSCVGLGLVAALGGFLCTLIVGAVNSPAIYIAIGVMVVVNGRAYLTGAGIEPPWFTIVSSITLAIGFLIGASAAAYKLDRR